MNQNELAPAMTQGEIALLKELLQNSGPSVVEFGSGGSTLLAVRLNVEYIYSIEASMKWIQILEQNPIIKTAQKNGQLELNFIDINGNDEFFSYPKDRSKVENWPLYYNPWATVKYSPYFILVDGRFRVACVLYSIKYLIENNLDAEIAVHDYLNRPQYHHITKYLDVVKHVETLWVFKKKDNISLKELNLSITQYENDFS